MPTNLVVIGNLIASEVIILAMEKGIKIFDKKLDLYVKSLKRECKEN